MERAGLRQVWGGQDVQREFGGKLELLLWHYGDLGHRKPARRFCCCF